MAFKQYNGISETSKVEVYCFGSTIFINLVSSQMSVKCKEGIYLYSMSLKGSRFSFFSVIKDDRQMRLFESPKSLYAFPWYHLARPHRRRGGGGPLILMNKEECLQTASISSENSLSDQKLLGNVHPSCKQEEGMS